MHGPFCPSMFYIYNRIIQQINNSILTRDGKSNNYMFLTYNGLLPEEAGLAHLGSAALESLLCSCTSDSKCSVCLSLRIPDEILLKEQQPNICALAVSSNKPVADWRCARKRPASAQTNAWYTHVYMWWDGVFQGTNHRCLCSRNAQ